MGEPWLDSLSEDWDPEPRIISPASSIASKRYSTLDPELSQSRIPHLAHNMRRQSSGSSYLKPRSTRGIAKAKGIPILTERSASNINLPTNSSRDVSEKRLPSSSSSTLPRRASSNFSESQQSVQRHTINTTSKETPEWKRRIQNGEDIASDGFDLFSPSKLEGMFAQPTSSTADQENESSFIVNETKPWSSLKLTNIQPATDQYQSFRTSRSRAPRMEPLPEMNEDDDEQELEYGMSAISSELARDGSLRGLVKKRVEDLEQVRSCSKPCGTSGSTASLSADDPRWRTLSGQQEIRNEVISPVTASTRNTISTKALRNSVELNAEALKQKLMDAGSDEQRRPSSRSSDRDVSYNGRGMEGESLLHEESLPDLTSHSLPEDLSMGTQDFAPNGGYINTRRGVGSNDTSFVRKKLSSMNDSSLLENRTTKHLNFRSSPPPYNINQNSIIDQTENEDSFEGTVDGGSVIHHETSPQRPPSSGSPLKLFGNRDTYTNNKLLRVLSQYEQDRSDHSQSTGDLSGSSEQRLQSDPGLRMSQFGKGELDTFNFEKEVQRPSPVEMLTQGDGGKIFQSFMDLTIDDEGTIPGTRPSVKETANQEVEQPEIKRQPSSPAKERTAKRRRTLLRDEINVDGVDLELKVDLVQDKTSLAGTKRKDAKAGEGGVQADAEVLASRSILCPKPESRRSSHNRTSQSTSQESTMKHAGIPEELTEALAAELASFAQGVSEAQHDSRKPSLATRDYMEEANKVMEFIRARGKPKTHMPQIQEPNDTSELDVDKILDLEVDDDSTVEPFSRPPSREGPVRPREDRRVAKHDPQIASHLQKFKDSDDLEILASTSMMGTLNLVDNQAALEAAQVPVPSEKQESSPPNIRILNDKDTKRKRKQSPMNNEALNSTQSLGNSTRRTFATESSNSSGKKGVISSGKVSIPDNVGTMTFDHEKQIWVKQNLIKQRKEKEAVAQPLDEVLNEVTVEEDPFASIPDLSIDEHQEAAMRLVVNPSSRPSTADAVDARQQHTLHDAVDKDEFHEDAGDASDNSIVEGEEDVSDHEPKYIREIQIQDAASVHPEASRHEERLHQGVPSKAPVLPGTPNMQPRVVTIAFSSPVASEIPPPVVDISASVSDDEDFLPPADSDDDIEYLKTPQAALRQPSSEAGQNTWSRSTDPKHRQYRSMTRDRRPVSRIDERDEDDMSNDGMSLVHLKEPHLTTPGPAKSNNIVSKPASAYKGSSMLCLTPLSEFTMHQVDKANHPEESFVQARAHPKALLQAHGSMALSVDTLIKAITDSVPDEPFWEQLQKLNLADNRLQSVHGLAEYCSCLESIDLSHNQISQLDGLPTTVRQLNISHNKVNDFTSLSHLQNLQYVDVSGNQLENLEGFSSLVHLRQLKLRGNSISDIEGVLDLDGLISLELQDNQLNEIDFEGVDLPRLEELDLSNNKLTTIRNLQYLPQLKKLNLSGNSLRELYIPGPLPNLKSLAISRNELEHLDLGMLPALRELDLDGNSIKVIHGLTGAVGLRKLSIREQRNSVDIVNQVLGVPNDCSEILLSLNAVPQGQLVLPKYPQYNLRHLEIAACGIRSLPTGFGDYFPNCRILNLNFNAISELSPLLGSVKLQRLFVAENRVNRLRRTCLALSRMPVLQTVDMRNNPLTVGFYPPDNGHKVDSNAYLMPERSSTHDIRWRQLLDETTGLKRKMMELLLTENCHALKIVDGLELDAADVKNRDTLWDGLETRGVLVKMIEAPPSGKRPSSAVEMPVDVTLAAEPPLQAFEKHEFDVHGLTWERSVMVE